MVAVGELFDLLPSQAIRVEQVWASELEPTVFCDIQPIDTGLQEMLILIIYSVPSLLKASTLYNNECESSHKRHF